ncbi:MAG: hypothetical protein GY765_39720 [bacterium]|nr:hypothetical protein [bacterium]
MPNSKATSRQIWIASVLASILFGGLVCLWAAAYRPEPVEDADSYKGLIIIRAEKDAQSIVSRLENLDRDDLLIEVEKIPRAGEQEAKRSDWFAVFLLLNQSLHPCHELLLVQGP